MLPNRRLQRNLQRFLGDLPGGHFASYAHSVSSDGSVVVGHGSSDPESEAFRWTSAGGMVGLGYLPGGHAGSYAYDVSADGSVIVGHSDSASGGQEAFIWDATNGMRNLRTLLVDDFGLDLTGWWLENASGISDDGLTIVGSGRNPSGHYEAWVADLSSEEPIPELTGKLPVLRGENGAPSM